MTRDEFIAKYRPRLLLFATEAWAVRRALPSDLGMLLDMHTQSLGGLLNEMYGDLHPLPPVRVPVPCTNGTPPAANGRPAVAGKVVPR